MRQYPRQIKQLIRQYAAQSYEAELSQALRELEQPFRFWHSGQISAEDLNRRIFDFTHGRARELWQRYQSGLADMQVAYAITTGLLRRDEVPAELLSHLQNLIAFYEREAAAPEACAK